MIRDMGMHTALIGLIGRIDEIVSNDQRSMLRKGVPQEILKQIQREVREKLIYQLQERFGSLEEARRSVSSNQRRLIKIIMDDAARGRVTPLMQ
jgi:hypothetical protein